MLNPVAFSCYKNLNLQKCEDSERTESRKPGKQTKGGFDLARQKDENREKAKQLFLDSDGLMKNTEIAEALGIDSAKVRKWKCVDKWNDALENKPKKRGGQKGNKNAKGHGAPVRNKNAETHGLNYTHVFKNPFEFEGKTYDKLTFNFEGLLGSDMIAVENEMAAVGEYVLSPEISTSFLSKMAARAAGVGSDLIEHLPIRDFGKIKNKSRDFLVTTGLTD